jgi:transcriptional regulator with XRE-family HTH domain
MLSTTPQHAIPMAAKEKPFYEQLGRRIADARKEAGITQVELAKVLGVAQQTMAHYEGGSARIAVAMLPTIARVLGLSIEELIGEPPKPGKRGPAPKLQQQMEKITQLPKPKQRFVMEMLDAVIQQQTSR